MKTRRTASCSSQPYYSESDVEHMCEDALRDCGYYPASPQRVNIDRFIEKRFNLSPRFEDMPSGVLGFSMFGPSGMESMHISQALADEEGPPAERRVSSTLAHEAGHGLMHGHLFVLPDDRATLFGQNQDVTGPKVLCRDQTHAGRRYDGRWWELQANMAIGPLLMPRKLLHEALGPYLVKRGSFGAEEVDPLRREEAVRDLAEMFEVNPAVARIRVDKIYKPLGNQLTL